MHSQRCVDSPVEYVNGLYASYYDSCQPFDGGTMQSQSFSICQVRVGASACCVVCNGIAHALPSICFTRADSPTCGQAPTPETITTTSYPGANCTGEGTDYDMTSGCLYGTDEYAMVYKCV